RPLDRYFPDLHGVLLDQLPSGVVVDGEIVMPTAHGLDFGGLQMRLHPAASRVAMLAKANPAAFVAFDLLEFDRKSLLDVPQQERRVRLEKLFRKIRRPLYLTPLRKKALEQHPWRAWAGAEAQSSRMPGGQSRWSAGKDLSWEPLRIERVCEVKYDHMEGDRFRHGTVFQRWRPDKKPKDCRYDQ